MNEAWSDPGSGCRTANFQPGSVVVAMTKISDPRPDTSTEPPLLVTTAWLDEPVPVPAELWLGLWSGISVVLGSVEKTIAGFDAGVVAKLRAGPNYTRPRQRMRPPLLPMQQRSRAACSCNRALAQGRHQRSYGHQRQGEQQG